MKCLFCDSILKHSDVFFNWLKSRKGNSSSEPCENGHFLRIINKGELVLEEAIWKPGVPGRINNSAVYDFEHKIWIIFNLKKEFEAIESWNKFCHMHDKTIKVKLDQIRKSRKMWLLCAKRLNLYKDIRILIGKYMNYKPIIFWK